MTPTVLGLRRKKGARLAMLTAYAYPGARLVAEGGVDLILVGDSLGMVVLGYESTTPVTMDDMVHHTKAAAPKYARSGCPGARRGPGARARRPHPADGVSVGGYKLQGKEEADARRIMEGAAALEAAGCWGVVPELAPAPLARLITERLAIPTIGIGAGPHCALHGSGRGDPRGSGALRRRSARWQLPGRGQELRHER